jgi:hypothetical protein
MDGPAHIMDGPFEEVLFRAIQFAVTKFLVTGSQVP